MIVDIIIPALNEAEALPYVLEPLIKLTNLHELRLSQMSIRQIIVVDNGSIDETASIAGSFGAHVVHEPRRGYGYACLAGINSLKSSPPDILLFVDADGSDDLNDLDELLAVFHHPLHQEFSNSREHLAHKGDREIALVIGSRPRLATPDALTPLQRFGNALSCFLLKLIFGAKFTDLGPFRAIRWPELMEMNMTDPTYGWTIEMQTKACVLGLSCAERDVHYHPRKAGKSKVSGTISGSFKAGVKILWTIAKAWLNKSV